MKVTMTRQDIEKVVDSLWDVREINQEEIGRAKQVSTTTREATMIANCFICGEEFVKLGNQPTCSGKCCDESRRLRGLPPRHARKKTEIRRCVICGKRFIPRRTSEACTKKCMQELINKNSREKRAPRVMERRRQRLFQRRQKRESVNQEARHEKIRKQTRKGYWAKTAAKKLGVPYDLFLMMQAKDRFANSPLGDQHESRQ